METNKICKRLDACSYAWAIRHNEKVATALWHQDLNRLTKKVWPSYVVLALVFPFICGAISIISNLGIQTPQPLPQVGKFRGCH